ncbi:MAG TPA: group II intron maturase-specific domain-containing protein [Chloroflexia bacterium]|nr:group II intron maturase-specific domain-containing protein [Chloroflexia bacterium]
MSLTVQARFGGGPMEKGFMEYLASGLAYLVIFHKDRQVIEKCQELLSNWLAEMGLELKPSKTRLTHTFERTPEGELGFNFLGFHIRQYPVGKYKSARNPKQQILGFKTIIKPSKEAVKRHYQKIKEVVDRHRSSTQLDLMLDLISIIWGWAGYYKTVSSKRIFAVLDSRVYYKLYVWARRRHPLKSRSWVYHRYWRKSGGKGITFTLAGADYRLRQHAEMPIERHIKVQGSRSPFDGDWVYWSSRLGKHPQVSARVAKLLKWQRGKCRHCKRYFRDGDKLEVDHIIPKQQGGKDSWFNLQLLHRHCHDQKTALDPNKVVKVR